MYFVDFELMMYFSKYWTVILLYLRLATVALSPDNVINNKKRLLKPETYDVHKIDLDGVNDVYHYNG